MAFKVNVCFTLTQDGGDVKLLISFINYFKCGKVYPNITWYDLKITKLDDIINKIITFFQKYPIEGAKAIDFANWCLVAYIIKNKGHLTQEYLDKIKQIKAGINIGRN